MNTQQLARNQLKRIEYVFSSLAPFNPDESALWDLESTLEGLFKDLEAAERERDELRSDVELGMQLIKRMERQVLDYQAEIARRDAAAGEPVALRWRFIPMYSDVPLMHWTYIDNPKFFPGIRAMEGAEVQEVFSAAPPAVLPPERVSLNNGVIGFDEGYNQCRADALALGAQQQKVVEMPMPFDVAINLTRTCGDIEYQYHESGEHFDRDEIFSALDAANVKWEVKP